MESASFPEYERVAGSLGRPRWLEFEGQSTREERVAERELQRCKYHISIELSTDEDTLVRKLPKVVENCQKKARRSNTQSSHMARNSAFFQKSE